MWFSLLATDMTGPTCYWSRDSAWAMSGTLSACLVVLEVYTDKPLPARRPICACTLNPWSVAYFSFLLLLIGDPAAVRGHALVAVAIPQLTPTRLQSCALTHPQAHCDISAGLWRAAGVQERPLRAGPADGGRRGSAALLPEAAGGGWGGLQGHAGLPGSQHRSCQPGGQPDCGHLRHAPPHCRLQKEQPPGTP